ncbi:MAG: FGGY-family carbohydrate kinase [Actinomycetaceae bacterium]|nr:FGGY-family carbohydrate kinase [Actinomycetaceae bacterium]
MGTTVNAGVESPIYKYDSTFRTHVSGIPGNYVFEVLQSSGSYLVGWFREALGDPELLGEPDPKLAAAAEISPGCEGLITLPYWNAVQSPYWYSVARGAVVGWRGSHSRAHMYRSILESIGYETRLNLNFIEAGTGVKLSGLRAMGGGTRSPLWRQIMADCTGLPITLCAQDEISALGAALLAMAATEAYPDVATAVAQMAQYGETIEPDMKMHERYCEIAAIQRELYPKLTDTFEKLYNLNQKYPSTRPESPKAEI